MVGRAILIEHARVGLTEYYMTSEELAMCITCMPELFDSRFIETCRRAAMTTY